MTKVLNTISVVFYVVSSGAFAEAPHTVKISQERSGGSNPVATVDVCNRTLEVRVALEKALKKTCDLISAADLASLAELNVTTTHTSKIMLHVGDFDGLSSLEKLKISNYYMDALPEQIFRDLSKLQVLELETALKEPLSRGTFAKLKNLRELRISSSTYPVSGETVPGLFDELTSLEKLTLLEQRLTELPKGIFSKLGSLKSLRINNQPPHLLTARASSCVSASRARKLLFKRSSP